MNASTTINSRRRLVLCIGILSTLSLALLFVLFFTPERPSLFAAQEKEDHGGNIVFEVKKNKAKKPHVLFSHDSHMDAGHECKDCHNNKVFKSKKKLGVNSFTMKDVIKGKACGHCHNDKMKVKGKTVFGPRNKCEKCHNMKWRKRKR